MIIWTGYGFVIAIIGVISLVAAQTGVNAVMGDPTYYDEHAWVKTLAMIFAAALTWQFAVVTRKINKARNLVDEETEKSVVLKRSDSLFFIDARYWPIIYLVIGIAFLFI